MKNEALKNEYLTVADVKSYRNISQSQAYALVHRKDFPVCHFGGSIRIPRGLFLTWVERNTNVPAGLTA